MTTPARPDLGLWLTLPSPEIAEVVAATGFDFVIVDLEHGAIGFETALRMLIALAAAPTLPFVRIPEISEAWVKRMLDAGAAAVMVPRVEDAATAARIAAWATYGPEGRRGEGLGAARAGGWGRDADGYRRRWCATGGLILQIESAAGLEAAPEIAAIPGVSQIFFGPADFSASLGVERSDPRVAAAARRTAAIARAAGRQAGSTLFPGHGFAEVAAMGFGHIATASDLSLLVAGLDAHLAGARAETAADPGHAQG